MANTPESNKLPYTDNPQSFGTIPLQPRQPRNEPQVPPQVHSQAAVPPQARRPEMPQSDSRSTVIQGFPQPPSNYRAYDAPQKKSYKGLTIGIIAGLLLLLGVAGLIFMLKSSDTPQEEPVEGAVEVEMPELSEPVRPAETAEAIPVEPAGSADAETVQSAEAKPDQPADASANGAGGQSLSLFNRPLTYAGTVTPGGAASLNIILFQNGRIEGTLDYSGGKSMPVYGSYTWTDNGHKMNVNLTVSSKTDSSYSESWTGSSSYIKDNLAHTLTFGRINTSTGQSMTASFALK